MLQAMRESGIHSAKLESNLNRDATILEQLATRLADESDMTHAQRVVDGLLRFREYATGVDRGALVNPAAKVAADVSHLGGAYLFQFRSAMSDLQREGLYFHYLSEGKTPAQAAAAANTVLMDMRLAPAYAKVVSRYWPFFRWVAMSGPRSIVTILRKPAIAMGYQRTASLSDTATEDGKNDVRRILSRDAGYINLGVDERGGSRVYVNPRNWDPTNTIPQLFDWSGTKVGAVGLPWYVTLVTGLQWGVDRNGRPVYSEALDGKPGGFGEAFANDPRATITAAAKYAYSVFRPSYAPGSSRAQQWVASVLETAKLPEDGSKDITIAQTLTNSDWGRSFLLYMQQGEVGLARGVPLTGNRKSPYSDAPASLAVSSANFLVPLVSVNANLHKQGEAQRQVSVDLLNLQNWLSGETKRLQGMKAAGATSAEIRAEQARIRLEYRKRQAKAGALIKMTR